MDTDTIRKVRDRAAGLCEYCRLPEALQLAPFQIDHVIAKQHGGSDEPENLALACIHCNRHKGPNIAGLDPDNGNLSRLYHPRKDDWNVHFRWNGPEIVPLTAIGRVTVRVLFMNDPQLLLLRSCLNAEITPPRGPVR